MFSFIPVPLPPDCSVCGAKPLADHAEDCNYLRVIRVQNYPSVIDRNGLPWYMNAIRERDEKIVNLEKLNNQTETMKGKQI